LSNKRFIVHKSSAGNEASTVVFLKYLPSLFEQSTQLVIIWDGASYHRSALVQQFLSQINGTLPPEQWKITCIRLAPNAPEQNQVGGLWLQAKQFIRKFARLCKKFRSVKLLFQLFTHLQTFFFLRLLCTAYCSCPI
jgi:transposase